MLFLQPEEFKWDPQINFKNPIDFKYQRTYKM